MTMKILARILLLSCLAVGSSNAFCPIQNYKKRLVSYQHRLSTTTTTTTASDNNNNSYEEYSNKEGFYEQLASMLAQTIPMEKRQQRKMEFLTLLRVSIPSILIGLFATLAFPGLAILLATRVVGDAGALTVLSVDSSQFVQNFLTVSSLLFSILVGQTYYFMYQQQESVFYALFNEVTEAKSLLEQVALVCQGRSMYQRCLDSISKYVQHDLKKLQADPAVLLSARPVDDPLESIMYMTSVGVPSTVYETVKSLRQARASRLGALQRKLPRAHMWLLWVLAGIELVSFPLLGAGTQVIGGYNILTVEGILFGVMTMGISLTLKVTGELWRPAGGAYNVDQVLDVMVSGLEDELEARQSGTKVYSAKQQAPSTPRDNNNYRNPRKEEKTRPTIQSQGADILVAGQRIFQWVRRWRRRSKQ